MNSQIYKREIDDCRIYSIDTNLNVQEYLKENTIEL